MARFTPMGVSAVIDGHREYMRNMGSMASETERTHSRIGRLGSASFGGLVKGAKFAATAIVGITAAAGAAAAAIGGIAVKLAIDATPLLDMEKGFAAIAANAGLVGSEVLAAMKDVTAGTIRAADLMQVYNKGTTLLGENFNDIIPIMDQLIAQGAAIGLSPLQAVEDFTTGVARESKMILDNLGIIVKIEDATAAYAETLGKTADELSATERQAAILAAAQESLFKTSKALPSLNEFASTSLNRMKVTMQETRDEIGKALVPVLKEFVDTLQTSLGPEALSIVDIFKRDFVPVLTTIARFLAANMPKAIDFAKNAFIFLGRVIRGFWNFVEKWVIPGLNFLYRIFVDKIAPGVQKAWEFFTNLFDTLLGGIPSIDSVKDTLLGMIPQPVKDAIDTLKTKWGEWKSLAEEWWTTNGPDLIQGFADVRDYIVNDFIPNALTFLVESFEPVKESAAGLWEALMDQKPNVIAAWDEIKREAEETFGKLIPGWLDNLERIWTNLMTLISMDIDSTTGQIDTWGAKFIETLGDIVTLGIDVLAIAITGLLQLILLLTESLVAISTGDWSKVGELFTEFGEQDRDLIKDFGLDIMDLLGMDEPTTTDPAPIFHDFVPAPETITLPEGGTYPAPVTDQDFHLTINTSAPVEPVIADFRMLAALAVVR